MKPDCNLIFALYSNALRTKLIQYGHALWMGVATLARTYREVKLERIPTASPPSPGWVRVRGEIRDVRKYNKTTYFELTSVGAKPDELHTLSAEVSEADLQQMEGYWLRTKGKKKFPFDEGQDVVLEGRLSLDESWKYHFGAKHIKEGHGVGRLTKAETAALRTLTARGAESWRVGDVSQLRNQSGYWESPRTLQKLLVIVGQGTNAESDIKSKLGRIPTETLEIKYQSVHWDEQHLNQALTEARKLRMDLILIATGGGPQSRRHKYQDAASAELILKSEVPVVTALGHARDISLADRMATHAFDTPDHTAKSIASAVFASKRKQRDELKTQQTRKVAEHDEARLRNTFKALRRITLCPWTIVTSSRQHSSS